MQFRNAGVRLLAFVNSSSFTGEMYTKVWDGCECSWRESVV